MCDNNTIVTKTGIVNIYVKLKTILKSIFQTIEFANRQ